MGYNYIRTYKKLAQTKRKMLREDLKLILAFFGFKVKENKLC